MRVFGIPLLTIDRDDPDDDDPGDCTTTPVGFAPPVNNWLGDAPGDI